MSPDWILLIILGSVSLLVIIAGFIIAMYMIRDARKHRSQTNSKQFMAEIQQFRNKISQREGLTIIFLCAAIGAIGGGVVGILAKNLRFMDMGLFAGLLIGSAVDLLLVLRGRKR